MLVGQRDEFGRPQRLIGIVPTLTGGHGREDVLDYELWGRVSLTVDRSWPQGEIIGWYASRPGMKGKLTTNDADTHRRFFANPSQIMIVIDPAIQHGAAYHLDGEHFMLVDQGELGIGLNLVDAGARDSGTRTATAALIGVAGGLILWLLTGADGGVLG